MSRMELLKYRAVSFDIFGTLIKRMVSTPDDIFRLVENKLDIMVKKPTNFCQKRLVAKNISRSNNRYYSINDIYEVIDLPQQIKNLAKTLETETEVDLCYPNFPIINIYNQCIEAGIKTYIITDMYLDRNTIMRMLSKCGI